MSSFASPQLTAEVTAVARSLWISYCAIFAGSSLVIWDHISSFSHEVNFIWGRKLNSVTLLFHLNRWTTFIWAIMNATLVLPLANVTSCEGDNDFGQVLTILLFIFWAAFSGVRVYAISGGIWWPSAIVCALSLVPAGTNLYGSLIAFYYQVEAIPALGPECISGKTFSAALSTKFTIATRVCVIASDAIVLLVTWYKTYKIKRLADQNDVETPLVTMLLRDGTLYFAALLVLNIFNIVGWVTNIFVFSVQDFTTPLSSVIISHFLMNLRQASSTGNQEMTSQSWSDEQGRSPAVSLRFASFIDNMGESLTHGYDPADTDFSLTKVHDTNLPEDEISVSMIPSTAPHFPQTSIE